MRTALAVLAAALLATAPLFTASGAPGPTLEYKFGEGKAPSKAERGNESRPPTNASPNSTKALHFAFVPAHRDIRANETAHYKLHVTNSGNASLLVRVHVLNVTAGWTGQVDGASAVFLLAPGATKALNASLTPSHNATQGSPGKLNVHVEGHDVRTLATHHARAAATARVIA